METDEIEVQPEPAHRLILTKEALYYLNIIAGWANFLAVVGFVFCGLILILALSFGAIMAAIAKMSPFGIPLPQGVIIILSVVYLLIAVIYFFFPLYLYQFSTRLKKALVYSDSLVLDDAFKKLKSFFKYWGIITIVILVIYTLALILPLIGTLIAGSPIHVSSSL